MGMSIRAYARHRGLKSDNSVRKAITAGRITTESDGTIDPVKADREWDETTDPSFQRAPSDDQAPAPAVEPEQPALGKDLSLTRARTADVAVRAKTNELRYQKLKGTLVDKEKAKALFFTLARQERDSWLGFPARFAALMAADLECDAHAVEAALDKFIRAHLESMKDPSFAID